MRERIGDEDVWSARSIRTVAHSAIAALLVGGLSMACNTKSLEQGAPGALEQLRTQAINACEAYANAMDACLTKSVGDGDHNATASIRSLSSDLDSPSVESLTALRQRCTDGRDRITELCR